MIVKLEQGSQEWLDYRKTSLMLVKRLFYMVVDLQALKI